MGLLLWATRKDVEEGCELAGNAVCPSVRQYSGKVLAGRILVTAEGGPY